VAALDVAAVVAATVVVGPPVVAALDALPVTTAVPGAAPPQAARRPIIVTAPTPAVAERKKARRLARGDGERNDCDMALPFMLTIDNQNKRLYGGGSIGQRLWRAARPELSHTIIHATPSPCKLGAKKVT